MAGVPSQLVDVFSSSFPILDFLIEIGILVALMTFILSEASKRRELRLSTIAERKREAFVEVLNCLTEIHRTCIGIYRLETMKSRLVTPGSLSGGLTIAYFEAGLTPPISLAHAQTPDQMDEERERLVEILFERHTGLQHRVGAALHGAMFLLDDLSAMDAAFDAHVKLLDLFRLSVHGQSEFEQQAMATGKSILDARTALVHDFRREYSLFSPRWRFRRKQL